MVLALAIRFLLLVSIVALSTTNGELHEVTCAHGWGYNDNDGPSMWTQGCPACGGSSQSPIAIQPDIVTLAKFEPIKFNNYDVPMPHLPVLDNGHSEEVEIPHDLGISIEIPTRPGVVYKLAQIHFHWGRKDYGHGSEHAIGDKFFPLEIHLVHKANANALAVLAVFGELHCSGENNVLDALSKSIIPNPVIRPNVVTKLKTDVKVMDILPSNRSLFFSYSGSLTTPPCSEIVDWIVFENPIPVHPTLLSELRQVINSDNTRMIRNFRPPQPLNGRTVYYSGAVMPINPMPATVNFTDCQPDSNQVASNTVLGGSATNNVVPVPVPAPNSNDIAANNVNNVNVDANSIVASAPAINTDVVVNKDMPGIAAAVSDVAAISSNVAASTDNNNVAAVSVTNNSGVVANKEVAAVVSNTDAAITSNSATSSSSSTAAVADVKQQQESASSSVQQNTSEAVSEVAEVVNSK